VSAVAPGAPGAGASIASMWNGVRFPDVVHRARPFQLRSGSSMRPSICFASPSYSQDEGRRELFESRYHRGALPSGYRARNRPIAARRAPADAPG
jgi:hypothetical protein